MSQSPTPTTGDNRGAGEPVPAPPGVAHPEADYSLSPVPRRHQPGLGGYPSPNGGGNRSVIAVMVVALTVAVLAGASAVYLLARGTNGQSAPASGPPTAESGVDTKVAVASPTSGSQRASATAVTTSPVPMPATSPSDRNANPASGTEVPPTVDPDEPRPRGAGCNVGDQLTDGSWYGKLEAGQIDPDNNTIDFDVVCWYVGEDAYKKAAEDGYSEDEVDGDLYIVNNNPRLRKVSVSPNIDVIAATTAGEPEPISLRELADRVDAGTPFPYVELTVLGGQAVKIVQIWMS